jgi:hypothetical protein
MWILFNSYFEAENGYENIIQNISSPIGGCDLLANHYNESHKPESTVNEKVKQDGVYCGIILLFLHSHINFPPKYLGILQTLKNEIIHHPNKVSVRPILSSIALLATTPANRTILYNNGFHSVIFDMLVGENTGNSELLYASQALCNMTCEESAERRNTILNAGSFIKLKSLMEKIICSSPSSVSSIYVAQKNAVIIENIFLILSNMLVGNKEALTPLMDSEFNSFIVNHLSPDNNNEQRKIAGNIENQQKAALYVLHSITFHQTEHISNLIENFNILAHIKIAMDGKQKEIMELSISGVLYNIAVRGSVEGKNSEMNKNLYLEKFEKENGLMEIIYPATQPLSKFPRFSSPYGARMKQYTALLIGQLYRNKKLNENFKDIITTLKSLKTGSDSDLSFKAQNTLEVLGENNGV